MSKKIKMIKRFPTGGLFIASILFLIVDSTYADNTRWWITGTLQTTEGKYIYESKGQSNYLTIGILSRGDRWALSVNVPYIYQQNSSFTQTSEMIVITEGDDHAGNGMHGGNNHQDPITEIIEIEETILPDPEYGFGDIYLFGNVKLFGKTHKMSGVFLNSQIKFPVANIEKDLGTGEYDYGLNLSFKQSVESFYIFSDIGILVIGDSDDFKYNDPLTWGVGIGKSFSNGKYSTSLYYQQYSKIFDNYEPPRQIALGINYRMNNDIILSLSGIKGFSEISPNAGLSGSILWAIN